MAGHVKKIKKLMLLKHAQNNEESVSNLIWKNFQINLLKDCLCKHCGRSVILIFFYLNIFRGLQVNTLIE